MAGIGTISPTVDVTANPLAAAQLSTLYGPQTQQALRRSQYLADALRSIGSGERPITGGWGELAGKLLATAILQRANDKGQDRLNAAMRADQDQESARLLAGLNPPSEAPSAGLSLPQPQSQPQPQLQPQAAPEPAPAEPPATPPAQYSAQDHDALTRMLATEALGEGPDGMAAAGHVALNRLKSGYGGAKTLAEIINQPHQFTGMAKAGQVSPEAYAKAAEVADGLLAGRIPDPTGGAEAFLNPELTQQLYGRIPRWAQGGDGHRIGRHVFFGGAPQGQQIAAATEPPAPPGPNGPDAQPTMGADPFPAPAQSPAAGPAPAGGSPQAPPAGATGSWPMWRPSKAELDYVQSLLNSPRDHAAGVALAQHYRQKMTEPEEAQITLINGVPFYIPKDPTSAATTRPIPVPEAAKTHIATPEQLGVSAPPGTSLAVDPLGNPKVLTQPATGQMVTSKPGQPYAEHYIPGGSNDPTVPQKPQQGYAYGPGGQAPIAGGPADPHAGLNLVAGEAKLRDDYEKQVAPYIAAREGYQKVIQAAGDQTQAGAIALVFGYMKTLDPGSTVREGEQASVQNSGTIPQTITNMYNKLIAGQSSLTPEQRAQFANSAKTQFEVYQRTFDAANSRFSDLAKSYQYDPNRIVRQFDPIQPFKPPEPSGATQAQRNRYIALDQAGKLDLSKPLGHPAHPNAPATQELFDRMAADPRFKGQYAISPDGRLAVFD